LSDHFFEQFFGRDPGVVGRQVMLATRTVTIKGVLPSDFRLWVPLLAPLNSGSEVDIFATSPLTPANQARGNAQTTVRVIGKLKPGVSITAARVEMETIQKRIAEMNANPLDNAVAFQMSPLQERLVRDARPGLLVLMAAVGFVLIIAAVNIASLLLARTIVRRREIAIRSAIGAGATRLLRQFMSEGAVLGIFGGLAGVLFAKGAVTLMIRISAEAVPRLNTAAVDHRVLMFTLGSVVCSVIIFSFAPAITVWRSGFGSLISDRAFSAAANSVRMRRFLVGAEVGLAVVLLCAAGLMLRSFWKMNERPPGFTPEKVLALRVTLSGREYLPEHRPREYVDELLLRLENTTGVQAATVMSTGVRGVAEIEGAALPPALELPQVSFNSVSADFGRVLGMRLIEGRWLNDREASPAILVNESFARQVLRGDEPVGKRLRIPGPDDVMVGTIVGVVSNLKYARLDSEPDPEVYIPYAQSPFLRGLTVLVLASGDVAATAPGVRTAIAQIDRTQPVFAVATLEERLAESIAPWRFNMFLLGTFAAAALVLALVGIYGVVAYSITQRTREIGVRIALGARAVQVTRMIIRQGMAIVLAGTLIGLIAASALTQAMKNLLYGIEPTDAPTLVSVTLLLVAGGLFATLIPAMRAARLDPSITLRSE
jgi:putative ABC transport system permease protein